MELIVAVGLVDACHPQPLYRAAAALAVGVIAVGVIAAADGGEPGGVVRSVSR